MANAFTIIPPPLGSDGGCTGFPDSLGPMDWHTCCLVHDAGGSDGMLYDCIIEHTSGYAAPIVLLALLLLVLLRKPYNLLQKWKIMK